MRIGTVDAWTGQPQSNGSKTIINQATIYRKAKASRISVRIGTVDAWTGQPQSNGSKTIINQATIYFASYHACMLQLQQLMLFFHYYQCCCSAACSSKGRRHKFISRIQVKWTHRSTTVLFEVCKQIKGQDVQLVLGCYSK